MPPIRCIAAVFLALVLMISFTKAAPARGYRHYVIGDITKPTPGVVSGGLLLMGGGDRNVDSLKWFIEKAGHGHIVILRASQSTSIADELYRDVGGIASAETFVFSNRKAAYDPKVLASLKRADGIFISGGDQARYVKFWKGTPIAKALDAHVAAGKPIAGTSAGLAIQGEYLYGAMDGGSITSAEALADPLGPANTIETDFLHFPLLNGIITDTHFKERNRLGRLFAFLVKAETLRPNGSSPLIGLGVDESAALAVEHDGTARIYATAPDGGAWLVQGGFSVSAHTGAPLTLDRVQVMGVGLSSRVHLPDGHVENPSFLRYYTVASGQLHEVP
jgi:cyanophycinase